ncbi:MAG: BlaI/MecI/CopY family transcriptional regulator [Acetatifactor sp.]|nr:BlaI/MecI/CopY family transcriptional regulator [Acetatifactor sp.]
MGEITPSENEWLVMEIIWKAGRSMTAAEVIKELKDSVCISDKTIRVMINRLVAKGVLEYSVDEKDARVYHYRAVRSREECQTLKSDRFVKNFFGGDVSLAIASFLRSAKISGEQLEELRNLVDEMEEAERTE